MTPSSKTLSYKYGTYTLQKYNHPPKIITESLIFSEEEEKEKEKRSREGCGLIYRLILKITGFGSSGILTGWSFSCNSLRFCSHLMSVYIDLMFGDDEVEDLVFKMFFFFFLGFNVALVLKDVFFC